jgi:4-amino-4-deoxy-L-arabinose transferase-like glycosyltransferase
MSWMTWSRDRGPVFVLSILAVGFVLQVFGVRSSWLPPSSVLAGLILTAHLLAIGCTPPSARDWRASLEAHAFGVGLCLLAVLALVVRIPGFDSDLGRVPLDVDEHRFASNVKEFFVTGALGHETAEHYPGAVFWLFAAGSLLNYVRGLMSGVLLEPQHVPVETFVQAARLVNILVAAGTVVATGWIGCRIGGRAVGLLGGLLVAVVPLSVEVSRLARNDPGMTLFVTLAVAVALAAHQHPRPARLLTAGALAGVAAGTKYTSVFALAPVLLAALLSDGIAWRRTQRAVIAFCGFVVGIGVTNHFVWADVPQFLLHLWEEVRHSGPGHWAASDNPGAFYVTMLDEFGPGLPLLLLAAAFAIYGLSTRYARYWILLAFPLTYVWFMTQQPAQFPRWVLPVVPFVAVAGAAALVGAVRVVGANADRWPGLGRRRAHLISGLLLLVVLAQPLWAGAVSFSRRITPATHLAAEAWLRAHAQPGSNVVIQEGWLDFSGSPLVVHRVSDLNALLDGGIETLVGCQWLVVPKPFFGHPTLRRVVLAQSFRVSQSFGGAEGSAYDVYAVPKLPLDGTCQPVGR